MSELPGSGVGLAAAQDMGKGLVLIAVPPALLVSVSVVDGTVEQQEVEMGPNDETSVSEACEVPMGHEVVAGT